MKVALVHDYLNQYGGGERVLESLMEIFPEAPVYTLLHDRERTDDRFAGRVAATSFLDFSLARRYHRAFIPFMPLAARSIDLGDQYDLIISDTAGFAKGIRYGEKTKHISYIHTPLRYAWEQEEYLSGTMTNFKIQISKPILNYLKRWDYKAGQKPDILIANSNFIAEKVRRYYGREAQVIYPPVDTTRFYREIQKPKSKVQNYYLAMGRLLHYKRFDLIIDAFTKLGLPLKIVGSGPEESKLKTQIAKCKTGNIELTPFIKNENELRKLYNGAKALIFPQVEDFGLVAAEAQACGTPVIAYAAGGVLEIVENGKTGVLSGEQTAAGLATAVTQFEKKKFNRASIAMAGKRFSKERFKQQLVDVISKIR